MGVPGNANTLLLKSAAAGGAYEVSRSLRFNSGDSAYLSRTPASAGNRKKFTYSVWTKLAAIGTLQAFISARSDDNNRTTFFYQDSQLKFQNIISGSSATLNTSAVFRDPSAWYHILLSVDTDQGTSGNRVKIYVNGVEQALSGSYPGSGDSTQINNNVTHGIGRIEYQSPSPTGYFDGYMADPHLIDGIAADPSSFAETDATTGQWVPKAFTGSYGTNGFKLNFSSNSTTAALGTDSSGAGNTWTVNNFSVTAGSGNDSLVDTPTSYGTPDTGVGGEVRGNYATLNPLDSPSATTLSNGNLDAALPGLNTNGNLFSGATATIGITAGKFYFEGYLQTFNTYALLGVTRLSNNGQLMSSIDTYRISYSNDGAVYRDGTGLGNVTGLSTFGTGDLLGCAIDISAGTVAFFKNGTLIHTTTSAPVVGGNSWKFYIQSASNTWSVNFGQRAWAYPANASGFKALCDTNLPAPPVAKGSSAMDVKLYTGTGANQTISDLGFGPDLVWIKRRDGGNAHRLFDAVRGAQKHLTSAGTDAESTAATSLDAFNSDGFTLGANTDGQTNVNISGGSYVAWTWDAGSSTATNTEGSITSQVRANASAGFSVVTYTGTGANATVGHGLGVAPAFIIGKARTAAEHWQVGHSSIGWGARLFLSVTNAIDTSSAAWNNTAPTSTVFSMGISGNINNNGTTYVAYCFAPVAGYSSAFTFTGNGSSDGPFCFLGFRPKLLLIKRSDSTGNWLLVDSVRGTYNLDGTYLYANTSDAEATQSSGWDLLSNGFKNRNTYNDSNSSGATYVGFAWAENPFQYARAR
jgi:hypothetical protein